MLFLMTRLKQWFLGLSVFIAFFFLATTFSSTNPPKTSMEKIAYARNSKISNNLKLETPILCNYEVDEDTSTILQDCSNLVATEEMNVVGEIDISAFFKVREIEFYDQNKNTIPSAKIVGFSNLPYLLLPVYSFNCKEYCEPSRLFFQFKIRNDRQIQGVRLKGFRFRDKLRQSPITNYDPTQITAKFIKVSKKAVTYSQLREQLDNPNTADVLFNGKIDTPVSANQGLSSQNLVGVKVNIDFFNPNSNTDRAAFNLQHYSLTPEKCSTNLKKDLIGLLSPSEVCDYLVFQKSIANKFGDAKFIVPLDKISGIVNKNNSVLNISLTSEIFFEKLLLGYKEISFNTLSTSLLTDSQWKIFSVFHLSPKNNVLETLKLRFKNTNEAFFEKIFSLPKIKDLKELSLAGNHIVLTATTSKLLDKIDMASLDLSNNELDKTFLINNMHNKLHSINVSNTGWNQITSPDLWKKIPNIQEIFLAGTQINTLSLRQFANMLLDKSKIITIEADFSDINTLSMGDFKRAFPSLQRINVPLKHYKIKDIQSFIKDSQAFAGKIGLPINGTEFLNTNPAEVFNAANTLTNKIVDLKGKSISLYYDLYLSWLFRKFIDTYDFFKDPYAIKYKQDAIDEIIGSYKTLFDVSNINHSSTDSFSIKHQRTVRNFGKIESLIRANIVGRLASTFIEENNKLVTKYGLDNAPSELFIKNMIIVLILVVCMFISLIYIVWILFYRFFYKE